MFIYPYKEGSRSVSLLKGDLGAKSIKLFNSKFKGSPSKNVIVWGNSTPNEEVLKCNYLNTPAAIKRASNKLTFFKLAKNLINIPDFTVDSQEAYSWLKNGLVVGRTLLESSGGKGIKIFENEDEWETFNHTEIKVYTKYIPKIAEYRIHVFKGEPFDIQKKSIQIASKNANFRIQNHNNGFIFTRGNITSLPPSVLEQAVKSINLVGLDFGAVDIIYNKYRDKSYVLEINTAPGLEGTTLDSYLEVFNNYFKLGLKISKKPSVKKTLDNYLQQTNSASPYISTEIFPLLESTPEPEYEGGEYDEEE